MATASRSEPRAKLIFWGRADKKAANLDKSALTALPEPLRQDPGEGTYLGAHSEGTEWVQFLLGAAAVLQSRGLDPGRSLTQEREKSEGRAERKWRREGRGGR